MKTYKDVYEFPLKIHTYGSHIWDNKGNMVAQFLFRYDDITSRENILNVLNGIKEIPNNDIVFEHVKGEILADGKPIILIRGWGGLTGIGGYNLSFDEAAYIQGTFAEYILEKLNRKIPITYRGFA